MTGRLLAVLLMASAAAAASGPAPGASPTSKLSVATLRGSDVPGYSALPSDVATLENDQDSGTLQAFHDCAQGITLLDRFDSGSGAGSASVDSAEYGRGTNPYGGAVLEIGSAAFGDGVAEDAETAFIALSGRNFQGCWARESDHLNAQQGVTVPVHPTHVVGLADPHLGNSAVAFRMDSEYSGLGHTVHSDVTVLAVRRGAILFFLLGDGYDRSFPSAVIDGAAKAIDARLAPVVKYSRAGGAESLPRKTLKANLRVEPV